MRRTWTQQQHAARRAMLHKARPCNLPGCVTACVCCARQLQRSDDANEADSGPSSSTPTSIAALEECVRAHLGKLEAKLEALLQHISEELATEVGREQNHLMLMQDQVRPFSVSCMSCCQYSISELNSMNAIATK